MIDRKRGILRAFLDAINPYAWITAARNRAFDAGILKSRSYCIPTICIGNISVGGTGKTPHTEYLIRLLKEKHRIAVLSRGYGRSTKGYIKADAGSSMQQIGDEPFQIKNKFPGLSVAVCEKRVTGIDNLLAEEKFRSTGLLRKVFDTLAKGYTELGDVVHFEENLDNTAVRDLADMIADTCGGTAAVFSGSAAVSRQDRYSL